MIIFDLQLITTHQPSMFSDKAADDKELNLDVLPMEVICMIYKFLPPKDWARFRKVARRYAHASMPYSYFYVPSDMWQSFYVNHIFARFISTFVLTLLRLKNVQKIESCTNLWMSETHRGDISIKFDGDVGFVTCTPRTWLSVIGYKSWQWSFVEHNSVWYLAVVHAQPLDYQNQDALMLVRATSTDGGRAKWQLYHVDVEETAPSRI